MFKESPLSFTCVSTLHHSLRRQGFRVQPHLYTELKKSGPRLHPAFRLLSPLSTSPTCLAFVSHPSTLDSHVAQLSWATSIGTRHQLTIINSTGCNRPIEARLPRSLRQKEEAAVSFNGTRQLLRTTTTHQDRDIRPNSHDAPRASSSRCSRYFR